MRSMCEEKAKLNRTFASDAIQTEDEQSVQLSDSEYDDGDDAVELFREDLFEGDIVLTNNSYIVFNRNESITRQVVGRKSGNGSKVKVSEVQVRNAVRQKTLLWPNARVPYVISPEYDNISKQIIMDAFQEYRLLTCVQFVPKTQSDSNYIYIAPYDGCYSTVGNNGS
ncbi:unnamed protein product [Litomosoides sigmodontis]|uniref:Peptidase M12A domain-containing protein n=1 Tax=Litomosoides sigmodontis TaxID=42156 RepID=A0A3P6SWR2_LITSI|nr:unnamed protein product [Litomosoides sigmodontis]